jgi:hypothetical protein
MTDSRGGPQAPEGGQGVVSNDIVARLKAVADIVPEDLSALLIEAADEIRHLRDLLPVDDQTWLEGVKPEGKA